MVTVGCDVADSRAAIETARAHAGVCATAGVHPHEASGGVDGLEALLAEPEVVAVGECGLDLHYDHSPRDAQREVFAAQVELALDHDLALVIHTREAWDETFDVLARRRACPSAPCSTASPAGPDEARRCLDLGALPVLQRHRHVQDRRRPAGGGGAVPARPAARRDRQPVPRAGAAPGRGQPAGAACRWSARRSPRPRAMPVEAVAEAHLGGRRGGVPTGLIARDGCVTQCCGHVDRLLRNGLRPCVASARHARPARLRGAPQPRVLVVAAGRRPGVLIARSSRRAARSREAEPRGARPRAGGAAGARRGRDDATDAVDVDDDRRPTLEAPATMLVRAERRRRPPTAPPTHGADRPPPTRRARRRARRPPRRRATRRRRPPPATAQRPDRHGHLVRGRHRPAAAPTRRCRWAPSSPSPPWPSGRQVTCTVDDRGPFGDGHIIDLSPTGFQAARAARRRRHRGPHHLVARRG